MICERAFDQILNPISENLGGIGAETDEKSLGRPAGATGSLIRRQPNTLVISSTCPIRRLLATSAD